MSQSTVSGSLLILFLYDVCDAIDLDRLRQILGAPRAGREPPFRQPAPEYVQFAKPPVVEPLPPIAVAGAGSIGRRMVYYQYGVIAVQLEITFDTSWDHAVALAARWMNTPELERNATALLREHIAKAGPAIVNAYPEQLTEDYYIVHLLGCVTTTGQC